MRRKCCREGLAIHIFHRYPSGGSNYSCLTQAQAVAGGHRFGKGWINVNCDNCRAVAMPYLYEADRPPFEAVEEMFQK